MKKTETFFQFLLKRVNNTPQQRAQIEKAREEEDALLNEVLFHQAANIWIKLIFNFTCLERMLEEPS